MILLRVSVVLLSDISLRKASTKEKMFVDIVQSEKEKCQEKKCKDEAENDTKTFSVLYCIFRSWWWPNEWLKGSAGSNKISKVPKFSCCHCVCTGPLLTDWLTQRLDDAQIRIRIGNHARSKSRTSSFRITERGVYICGSISDTLPAADFAISLYIVRGHSSYVPCRVYPGVSNVGQFSVQAEVGHYSLFVQQTER